MERQLTLGEKAFVGSFGPSTLSEVEETKCGVEKLERCLAAGLQYSQFQDTQEEEKEVARLHESSRKIRKLKRKPVETGAVFPLCCGHHSRKSDFADGCPTFCPTFSANFASPP